MKADTVYKNPRNCVDFCFYASNKGLNSLLHHWPEPAGQDRDKEVKQASGD